MHKLLIGLEKPSLNMFDCIAIHHFIIILLNPTDYGNALTLSILATIISLGLTKLTKKLEKKDGNP